MIRIQIVRNEASQIVDCHITGHAEYDEHGYDIVCAAVSSLACTAVLGLEKVAKQSGTYTNSSGDLIIKLDGEITDQSQTILDTMMLGLEKISKQYGDFVTLSDM